MTLTSKPLSSVTASPLATGPILRAACPSSGQPDRRGHDLRRIGAHPDHWYPVAWGTDLKAGRALGVHFGDEPIAIVRTKSGTLFGVEDRCAHRQVPLSLGVVDGEILRCNYHGWTYDKAGACTNIPYLNTGEARLPSGIRAYPVCEVDGVLFVFPGNPALATARKPAHLGAMADPAYKTRRLNRSVDAHFSFMHENLMDMNHQFLHRRQMGSIKARCLGQRQGDDWLEVDYSFSRTGGEASLGEQVITSLMRGRDTSIKKNPYSDLMTVATRYPYQDLRLWVGREHVGKPVLHVWLGYQPLGEGQRSNRTFGYLSVLKPPIPGLIHAVWPLVTWFTEKIFTEDKDIVEQEQAAHDKQGCDMNHEVFPVIRDLRAVLARCGQPMDDIKI